MNTKALLEKFKTVPGGLWLFSKALCLKAPYFASIRPTFTVLEPGRGEATFPKRRAVLNHLGTVHAIALCNLCELVAGTTLEITLPPTHRWIPKSMKVDYIAKAASDVRAVTTISTADLPSAGGKSVVVAVFDRNDTLVARADIEMYVSLRKT